MVTCAQTFHKPWCLEIHHALQPAVLGNVKGHTGLWEQRWPQREGGWTHQLGLAPGWPSAGCAGDAQALIASGSAWEGVGGRGAALGGGTGLVSFRSPLEPLGL